jgi:hypothetical protein
MTIVNWTPTSKNIKTGNIPQAMIGNSVESCVESCRLSKCKFLPKKFGGDNGGDELPCYAWQGTGKMALWAVIKAKRRLKEKLEEITSKESKGQALTRKEKSQKRECLTRYTLKHALHNAWKGAKIVRLSAIGDPGVISTKEADDIKIQVSKEGMGICGYLHSWRQSKASSNWKGHLMASCDNLEQADEAIDKGWRVSVVLPVDFEGKGKKKNRFVTPKGRKGIICPALIEASITCNTCRLCVATKPGPVVGFPSHK